MTCAFVTNAFTHAKKLAQKGYQVFVPAEEIKATTEAIVGADHSKFDKITLLTFASLNRGIIITDRLQEQKYNQDATVYEVYQT